ncbi:hypothetical protein CC78DRAFT_464660 [Lojkania enalia]|uniref:WHIM1 domain-containing protein n=1 Tax=Lojkania enalia TaxID=147567 RepID=A0A9P4K8X2_9PLEO|nr:hypothetical protein CC78DRAFT_464660 [Didymosphaeria enalia]
MSDSDSSTLSSPPASEDEQIVPPITTTKAKPQQKKKKKKKKPNGTILSFFDPPSPPRKKRPASPPHEMVPEDNPDIPFIVMFRSRFSDAFPPKCPQFGPQDIERGVADPLPSPQVEALLCALLGLVLNRKKPVEKGHYGRALEESIQTQKSQWPRQWGSINPLSGGRSFNTMSPSERLTLLKTLALWSLNQSELVNNMIKEAYKARTTKDKNDTNIPLSVQPWGRDGDKRRYWLVEGRDDTSFRVYRESNPALKNVAWWSVAGSIDEIRTLARKLDDDDGTKEAKALSEKMLNAIPRFEATEEKRKRREYRLNRKAAFARPEPGFSLYEGRTRGKRMKYTFSDEEDIYSDATDVRRSARQSGRETPAAPAGPTVTASGRHVRSRAAGLYGESLLSGQTTERASPATGEYIRSDASEEPQQPTHGRSTRAATQTANGWPRGRKHIETYNAVDEMDDEDDATSWDGGDEDEDEGDQMDLDDEDDFGEQTSEDEEEQGPKSLVVRLRYPKGSFGASADVQSAVKDKRSIPSGIGQQSASSVGSPLSGAPLPAPAPVPEPASAPASTSSSAPQATVMASSPLPTTSISPNGFPVQQPQASIPTPVTLVEPASHRTPPPGDAYSLPKQEPHFSAPTPPYIAPEEPALKPQLPAQPQIQSPTTTIRESQPPSILITLPNPTPNSTGQ